MKKKLLSLVLAGAMVASTSVSAFAADTTISSYNEGSNTANVTINGSVEGNNGEIPSGTISVSVPTALNFKVDKNGTVNGGDIKITNNGVDTVDVIAIKFYDTTPTSGITVKTPSEFRSEASLDRSNVVLNIGGTNGEIAFFKSESSGGSENGIYNEAGSNVDEGIKVATINGSGSSDTLTLSGYAGTTQLNSEAGKNGVTDEFRLTLKISKASN
mgnify:CR=1 FL=1